MNHTDWLLIFIGIVIMILLLRGIGWDVGSKKEVKMDETNASRPEVEGFGFEEEWDSFKERHRLFFDRFHNLDSTLDKTFIRKVSLPEPVDKVVFYLGRVCCEDFMEILLLCSNGYGFGGMKLLRGMYERVVTARYLHLNPEETDNFLDYYWITQHKQVEAIKRTFGEPVLPSDKVKSLKEKYTELKENFTFSYCGECGASRVHHTWTKLDFVSMANKAGSVGKLIVPAYYVPLVQTHSTAGCIVSRLEGGEENARFQDGAQHEEADSTLMVAHNLLLNVLELEKEHFELNDVETEVQTCFTDFMDIWNKEPTEEEGEII